MSYSVCPDTITVSASRKVQLDQYEPIEAFVQQEYTVPDGLSREAFEEWREDCQDDVMAAAEEAAMRRHEEYVREEAFGDDS
jgi:hypothetical protein